MATRYHHTDPPRSYASKRCAPWVDSTGRSGNMKRPSVCAYLYLPSKHFSFRLFSSLTCIQTNWITDCPNHRISRAFPVVQTTRLTFPILAVGIIHATAERVASVRILENWDRLVNSDFGDGHSTGFDRFGALDPRSSFVAYERSICSLWLAHLKFSLRLFDGSLSMWSTVSWSSSLGRSNAIAMSRCSRWCLPLIPTRT